MSSAVALRRSASPSQTLSLFDDVGGEPTLDQMLTGVWEGLTARAQATCPVCGARMARELADEQPRSNNAPVAEAPLAGRCATCGSTFS